MSASPAFAPNLPSRHRKGLFGLALFQMATLFSVVALMALLYTLVDHAFGYAAIEYQVYPGDLGMDMYRLDDLPPEALVQVLAEYLPPGVYRSLDQDRPLAARPGPELAALVIQRVFQPKVVRTWSLTESLLHRDRIAAQARAELPYAEVRFVDWIDVRFLSRPQSSDPLRAGVRTAILGSLWLMAIALLTGLPLGVSAAIYLEEYADREHWFHRIVQANIHNLAGVPSIIYGILGLAVFVRGLAPITSGAIFGVAGDGATVNGRTLLSGGMTLGLLVLPLVIINTQEAIRAVPASLREAAYALGATRWQVVWHHVLPVALPGIMTGTILALSRALGETAPLVVVGASTFITFDPTGPFDRFTALPIQIYQWTARPQDVFRNLAAAASITLLALLLLLNSTAVYIRYRARQGR